MILDKEKIAIYNTYGWEMNDLFGIGISELLVLGFIALLVFGPKKLPEIGVAVGKGLRGFKDAVNTSEAVVDSRMTREGSQTPKNNGVSQIK